MTAIRKNNNTNRPVQTSQTSQPKNVTLPRHDKKNGQCLEPAPQRKDQAKKLVDKKTPQKAKRQAGNGYRKPKTDPKNTTQKGSNLFLQLGCALVSQQNSGLGGILNTACKANKALVDSKNKKAGKKDKIVSVGNAVVTATDVARKGVSSSFRKHSKGAFKKFFKKNPALFKKARKLVYKTAKSRAGGLALRAAGKVLGGISVYDDYKKYKKTASEYVNKDKHTTFKVYCSGVALGFGATSEAFKYIPSARRFVAPFGLAAAIVGVIRDAVE